MWMLKGICMRQIVSIYVCVLYCSGQLVVEQKVSAWWAVWADFGIHREKQQRAKDTSQAGVQRCVSVWERMHVEVFTYCLSKYSLFSQKQLFFSLSSLCIISQMPWVGASWSGHNGALCYGLWCPVLALTCFLPHAHNSAWKSYLDWAWSLRCCFSSSWFCSVSLCANESLHMLLTHILSLKTVWYVWL